MAYEQSETLIAGADEDRDGYMAALDMPTPLSLPPSLRGYSVTFSDLLLLTVRHDVINHINGLYRYYSSLPPALSFPVFTFHRLSSPGSLLVCRTTWLVWNWVIANGWLLPIGGLLSTRFWGNKCFFSVLKWLGKDLPKNAYVTVNLKLWENCVHPKFQPNSFFFFLLTGVTWYSHNILKVCAWLTWGRV